MSAAGLTTRDHAEVGLRFALITAVLVAAIGSADDLLEWPLLTSTIGPTIYVFAAHPDSAAARTRNAVVGHATAVAAGVASLAVFGLWHAAPATRTGHVDGPQVGATVTALALTLFVLELLHSHHAPAAATAMLISTGLARPGMPLLGLATGLAVALTLSPLVTRIPLFRRKAAREA